MARVKLTPKSWWDPNTPFSPAGLPFFYGWVVAFAGAMGVVASIPGQTIGVNVFAEELVEHLGLSRRALSDAYFWGTLSSGLLLPFVGSWYDRLGARRLVVLSSVGLGAALFYLSEVDFLPGLASEALGMEEGMPLWLSLAVGFFLIRFWGQGQLTLASRNMVGKWWRVHRGKVLSMSGIGVSACFSLTPIVFNELIEAFGWRDAWRVIGLALAVGFGLFAWLLFRDNPQECSLEIDGGVDAGSEDEQPNPEFVAVKDFTRREALSSYSFWVFCLIFGLQGCFFTGYAFHVVDVGRDLGVSKETMLGLFIPQMIVGAALSILVGWLSDRWRLKYLMCFMALGIVVGAYGLYLRSEYWTPILLVAGMSVANGCFGTLSGAFIPRFFGYAHMGRISSVFMSLLVVASAVGPSSFSLVQDVWGRYGPVYLAVCGLALVLSIAVLKADNPQRKLAGV